MLRLLIILLAWISRSPVAAAGSFHYEAALELPVSAPPRPTPYSPPRLPSPHAEEGPQLVQVEQEASAAWVAGDHLHGQLRTASLAVRRWLSASPCSPASRAAVVHVTHESDFQKRRKFPPHKTVLLILHRNLFLSTGLVLDRNFSCTIVYGAGGRHKTLFYQGWKAPVVSILSTSNVLFLNVGAKSGVNRHAYPCRFKEFTYGSSDNRVFCPAIYVRTSHHVQIARAYVYGRIDVFRSMYVKLDSLKATMPKSMYGRMGRTRPPFDSFDFGIHGVIRMGECGVGALLLPSHNVISNCEVYGGWELITLYRGAVGVSVSNNFLHDYEFAAIRAGADVSYTMDCLLTTISNNYIYSPPGKRLTGDSSAIYYCTHWFNPGNTASCNYVIGGEHCFYMDITGSGVSVEGGVCKHTMDGVKINGGKFNRVRGLIMEGVQHQVAYIECAFAYNQVNCLKAPGRTWELTRKAYYNSNAMNARFPYMRSICRPRSTVNGQLCNPRKSFSKQYTGGCSGLPYSNVGQLLVVNPTDKNVPLYFCERMPTVHRMNQLTMTNTTLAHAQFLGAGDYGLRPGSPIRALHRNFPSCPRRLIGPKPVPQHTYYRDFNQPEPGRFQHVVNLDFSTILHPHIPGI